MMVNHDLFKSVELTTGGACEVRKAFYTFLVFHSSITCLRVMKKRSQLITHNIQMLTHCLWLDLKCASLKAYERRLGHNFVVLLIQFVSNN